MPTFDERVGRLRQDFLDRLRQLSQLDGFVELNAVVQGDVAQGLGRNIAGENDKRNIAIELLPQFLRYLNSVHVVWQIVVGKDKIRWRRSLSQQFQSGGAIDGRRDTIALFVQEQLEVLAHFRVVLNDQDRSGARRCMHGCIVRAALKMVRGRSDAAQRQRDLNREY